MAGRGAFTHECGGLAGAASVGIQDRDYMRGQQQPARWPGPSDMFGTMVSTSARRNGISPCGSQAPVRGQYLQHIQFTQSAVSRAAESSYSVGGTTAAEVATLAHAMSLP